MSEDARWIACRMRKYVAQRQRLPFMAVSMAASLGVGFDASRADADIICPAWQYPHCGTSISIHARCTGWDPSADSPSTVTMGAPAAADTWV